MNDSPLNRESVVLAGLAASQGATLEPVQVQKFFFLVDKKISHLIGGPHFDFQPYAYGPFDKAVYIVLEQLERAGQVKIVREAVSQRRWFRLTAEGQRVGDAILAQLPEGVADFLRRLSQFVTERSFAELVAAIYDAYPEMRENSIFVRYA